MNYDEAKKRVKELRGFYIHLTVYLIVNLLLFALDNLDRGGWWFYYPMIGWGIGVAIHGATVFLGTSILGPDWEERKVKQLMGKPQNS